MAVRSWNPPHGEPGEVVVARVGNPLENPASSGKVRPVVLVRRDGCRWLVMRLTTKPHYRSGGERRPIPNPFRVGLNGPGYLWTDHLTAVCVLDVERHLGWVDMELAATVINHAGLPASDASALLRAACPLTTLDHGRERGAAGAGP